MRGLSAAQCLFICFFLLLFQSCPLNFKQGSGCKSSSWWRLEIKQKIPDRLE